MKKKQQKQTCIGTVITSEQLVYQAMAAMTPNGMFSNEANPFPGCWPLPAWSLQLPADTPIRRTSPRPALTHHLAFFRIKGEVRRVTPQGDQMPNAASSQPLFTLIETC